MRHIASRVLAVSLLFCVPCLAQTPAKPGQVLTEADVEAVVRKWVESHPEVMLQSIDRFVQAERKRQAENKNTVTSQVEAELASTRYAAVYGNPEGRVTVVYVMDAACGYCRRMTPVMDALLSENKDVKVVHRWVSFLGPASEYGERAALVLWKRYPGSYPEFYRRVMTMTSQTTVEALDKILSDVLGSDTGMQVRAEVAAGPTRTEMDEAVRWNLDLSRRAEVEGTPTFVVVGAGPEGIVRGAQPPDALREAFAKARAARR